MIFCPSNSLTVLIIRYHAHGKVVPGTFYYLCAHGKVLRFTTARVASGEVLRAASSRIQQAAEYTQRFVYNKRQAVSFTLYLL